MYKIDIMANRKHTIILFIGIIVTISFLFQWIYLILTGEKEIDILDLLVDLPLTMLMAFVSLLIVHATNKHFKYKDKVSESTPK